jgi:hypothetical protein
MKVWRLMAGVSFVLALHTTSASAQQGTPQEQQACRRDAIKFCREESASNDTFRVLACLKDNRAKISKPCQKVLESHGQ